MDKIDTLLGSKNQSLFNEDNFDISPEFPYIQHPCDPSLKFFITYDHIHLLKTQCNHLRDDDCKLPDGTIFNKDYFQDLLDKRDSSEFGMGRHLKHEQLFCKGQDRQAVAHTLHIFSHATADLSDYLYPNEQAYPVQAKVSKYIRVMANLHLVMSSNRNEEQPSKLHSPMGILSACITILLLLLQHF